MRRLSAAGLALASSFAAWSASGATFSINHLNVVAATGTHSGRYFDRAALDRMLRGVEKAAAGEPEPAAKQGGTP